MVKKFFSNVFRLEEYKEKQETLRIMHVEPIGTTGTESYAGYAHEEYLNTLLGTQRADMFDKMRRSDAQIQMLLSAVKAPILSSNWHVKPGDPNEEWAKEDAALVEHILFRDMDKPFYDFLKEALTFVDFGHSVFEVIDKPSSAPDLGTFNGVASFAFRSQRTIERWHLDPTTDKLKAVSQISNGDLSKTVEIPAEFLLVMTREKEGSNYEGISALRPCYGNWMRKNLYLKLNAIGIEKFAVPTPIVGVPDGLEGTPSYARMKLVLEKYMSHEKNFLIKPTGWDLQLHSNTYDPQKVEVSIDNEDKRMAKSFILNFLELGMNGFGSQSLSFDLSDFFLNSCDHTARIFSGSINQMIIPRLVKMNRGPRPRYPELTHTGISDKVGKEYSEVLKSLVDGQVLQPDDMLEGFVRKAFGLPEASEQGRRAKAQPAPAAIPAASPTLMERVRALRLARGEKA